MTRECTAEYSGIRGAPSFVVVGGGSSGVYSCIYQSCIIKKKSVQYSSALPYVVLNKTNETGTLVSLIMVVFSIDFTTTGACRVTQ